MNDVDSTFKAYRDILVILHESYVHIGKDDKAKLVISLIEEHDKPLSDILKVSHAIKDIEIHTLEKLNKSSTLGKETSSFLKSFEANKKSEQTAQLLNFIPGAGYLYLGQTQSAITAFLLNGLTSYAAGYFFYHGNIPAGVLFTSVEMGWYFGGIIGAKESAKLYNERLYENGASPILQKHELHPVLNLNHAF